MRKTTLASLLVCTVSLAGLISFMSNKVTAQQPVTEADNVSLTVYNRGTALVRDRRTFNLNEGQTTLNFTDVAALIDPTSVIFKSLTDPDNTLVLEQNYVYDLVDSSALLGRYLDQRIEAVGEDGTLYGGVLLIGRNGELILRQDDGQVLVVSVSKLREMRFPDLPGGLITRPTLRWLVQSGTAGDQQLELTYLTGGINWTADYNILLATDNRTLDLNGWVTLNNHSGTAFTDALVKLVAGDVNRIQPTQPRLQRMEMATPTALASATMPAQVQQRELFEYNLYELTRRVTVGNNETKQVEFVTGTNIPASTFYVYDGSMPIYGYYSPITDQNYGQTGVTDVRSYLEFTTSEEDGLGADLPAGRIRVYQLDTDESAVLIGENRIDHTPEGEELEIYLGNAFDLVGERRQTNFQFISSNVIEETYEIRLRNRKETQAVEIRVPERMFRWSNWQVLTASHDFTKTDSSSIEFRVMVEPGQETVITYTVRYTWPG